MTAVAARPLAAAGIALLGAGIIAAAPASTPVTLAIPHFNAPEIALQASIVDIFKFPAFQQNIANQIEILAIEAQGLAEAGQGAVQSLLSLPTALFTAAQQTFGGNPLDGLTTVQNWVVDSATATFVPIISARITVGQIGLAIQSALLPAEPLAIVSAASGVFNGADLISRAVITAGQDLVQAVLSLNIQNIVQAVANGVRDVATSIGAGMQVAVDGIVGAQNLIADALAARPTSPPLAARPGAAAIAETPAQAPQSAAAVRASAGAARAHRAAVTTPRAAAAAQSQSDSSAADAPAKSGISRRAAGR